MGELKEGKMTGLIEKFLGEMNPSSETKRVYRMVLISFRNWLGGKGYKSIGV